MCTVLVDKDKDPKFVASNLIFSDERKKFTIDNIINKLSEFEVKIDRYDLKNYLNELCNIGKIQKDGNLFIISA